MSHLLSLLSHVNCSEDLKTKSSSCSALCINNNCSNMLMSSKLLHLLCVYSTYLYQDKKEQGKYLKCGRPQLSSCLEIAACTGIYCSKNVEDKYYLLKFLVCIPLENIYYT